MRSLEERSLKTFEEFETVYSILLTKYCSHRIENPLRILSQASSEAQDVCHRAMRPASQRCIRMVIETASNIYDSVVVHNLS